MWHCLRDPICSRFDTIPTCDRHTDRRRIVSRDKNDNKASRKTAKTQGKFSRAISSLSFSLRESDNIKGYSCRGAKVQLTSEPMHLRKSILQLLNDMLITSYYYDSVSSQTV